MEEAHHLTFGPFRLDSRHGHIWPGDRRATLRPRTRAMLWHLVAHAGRVVTKGELRQHVRAKTHVTDSMLRACVREIWAALSLSRLWSQRGKRDNARHLLAEVYAWFTEGFDTPDLQEAQALAAELS